MGDGRPSESWNPGHTDMDGDHEIVRPYGDVHYDETWYASFLRPFIITTLVACLVVAFISFFRFVNPQLSPRLGQLLLGFSVFASLVGGYTTTLLVQPAHRQRRTLVFRLAELGLLLGLARLLVWLLIEGFPPLRALLYQPLSILFSGNYILTIVLVSLAWGLTVYVTNDFLGMALQPDELRELDPELLRTGGSDHRIQSDRGSMLLAFTQRWTGGAFLLILLTAATRIDVGGNGLFALAQQAIDPWVIGATVVYFLLGFLLLTIGRLAVLRAQWQIQGIPSNDAIVHNWPVYAIALVGVIALIAFVMPLGGTFRLAQLIGLVIDILYAIVYLIFGAMIALLSLLGSSSEEIPPEEEVAAPAMPPPEAAATRTELPPWVGGTAFWITMGLLLGYAAYIYLQGRGVRLALLLQYLKQFWQRLLNLGHSLERWRTAERVTPSAEEPPAAGRPLRRWWDGLRLGRLAPDQQIRYFYLRILDDASDQELPRRPGETPYRYGDRLDVELAEGEDGSVQILTEQFVQIHYAARSVAGEQLPFYREVWERIRTAIAAYGRARAAGADPEHPPGQRAQPEPGTNNDVDG